MSGKAATFGGRMMGPVADQVLKQFAANFAARVQAMQAQPARTARRRRRGAARRPAARRAPSRSTAWRWRGPCSRAGCARCSRRSSHERCAAAPKALARARWSRAAGEGDDRRRALRAIELAALQQDLARAGYIAEPPPGRGAAADAGPGSARCCSKATPASARPRSPRCWPRMRGTRLIRLQCYEGLDAHAAMYEWNYQRQLLAIKLLEHDERGLQQKEQDIFSERYLLKRPLLEAITGDAAAGAADRRDRPRRRGLRGLPARAAVGLPALDSRARHRARDAPAAGGDHLQRHARAVRRAAAALPVPVHRLPRLRQGAGHRAQEGARGGAGAGAADRRLRAGRAPHGAAEEARHRRDAGLDRGAAAPGHRRRSTSTAPSASWTR